MENERTRSLVIVSDPRAAHNYGDAQSQALTIRQLQSALPTAPHILSQYGIKPSVPARRRTGQDQSDQSIQAVQHRDDVGFRVLIVPSQEDIAVTGDAGRIDHDPVVHRVERLAQLRTRQSGL